jgi:stage II sporulation protein P
MKLEEKTLRIGAAILLVAIILRIFAPVNLTYLFSKDGFISTMIVLSTGRWVDGPKEQSVLPEENEPLQAVFSLQELTAVTLDNPQQFQVDLHQALYTPLDWELANDAPAVLIVHSHATEAFANSPNWRSEDSSYNMVSVGEQVATLLEEAGIQVIHDQSIHDLPSYDAAYDSSRAAIEDYLERYPSIQLVLDLHRDAAEDGRGNQVGYTANYNGQDAATMMLVISAYDYRSGGTTWQRNLAFATKLQLQLEQLCPGICRPLALRVSDFSQDISPTGLLVEMGFAGNEQEEVLHSARLLAEAIIALQHGSQIVTAVSIP